MLNIGIFAYKFVLILYEFYTVEYINDSEFLIAFGNNLKKVRKSKGFTQVELANDLGIEISQISRIERGVINTSIGNIFLISKILKIQVKDLFDF